MDLDGIKLSELPITQQPPIDGTLVISSATEGSKRINLAAFIQYLKENGDFNKFLNGLEDVVINSPVEGQVLGYDEHFEKWTNIAGGGGGGSSDVEVLSDLSDIKIVSLANGQILKYNILTHKWENTNDTIENLTNVDCVDIEDGQVLIYDATNNKWVNGTVQGGGGGSSTAIIYLTNFDQLPGHGSQTAANAFYSVAIEGLTDMNINDNSGGGGGGVLYA